MPNTDPALRFPGRGGRGDYCAVRKRELGLDKSPGEGKPMVMCPYCLPSDYWLKWLILIGSFLAAVDNLQGCSASFYYLWLSSLL